MHLNVVPACACLQIVFVVAAVQRFKQFANIRLRGGMSADFSISHEALDAFAEAWAQAARHMQAAEVVDDLEDAQENLRNSLCFAAFFVALQDEEHNCRLLYRLRALLNCVFLRPHGDRRRADLLRDPQKVGFARLAVYMPAFTDDWQTVLSRAAVHVAEIQSARRVLAYLGHALREIPARNRELCWTSTACRLLLRAERALRQEVSPSNGHCSVVAD